MRDARTPRLSRRSLLSLGVLSFGALSRGVLAKSNARAESRTAPTLVFVFLRGALDGLSAIVPHQERSYYESRRRIAIAPPGRGPGACIDLDGSFGLHPALAALLPAYRSGELAAIHAVGSTDETRSHFDAQDFLELGTPGRKLGPGWLTRLSHALPAGEAIARAIAVEAPVPRSLHGLDGVFSFDRRERLKPAGDAALPRLARAGFERMYGGAQGDDPVRTTGARAFEVLRTLEPLLDEPPSVSYPDFPFARTLATTARLVKARAAPILTTSLGDWDTHRGQGAAEGRLANQLREFGESRAAFRADLGDHLEHVLVLVATEFGRTVRENGSGGTDHGHGSVMFALGGSVRGGRVHGRWPGLADDHLHDGRDLAVTTDFRDVFQEVALHLGASASLFPGHAVRPLGVLR